MSKLKKVRFGVIGCGNIAQRTVMPLFAAGPLTELIAVASRDRSKAEVLGQQYNCTPVVGYEDLLTREDIDAVYIGLPIGLHCEWAVKAANNGKHVLCEKSLARDLKETESIIDACQRNNVALLEGFAYQFHSQHSVVKELIAAGDIGEPILFQAWFGFPPIKSNHRYDPRLGGGALLDAGTYTVHAARHFFESEPNMVSAVLDYGDRPVDIHGTVLLGFNHNRTATLAFGFNNTYRNSYSIWGTKGSLTLNRVFSTPPHFSPTLILEQQGLRTERALPACDHFFEEIQIFCNNLDNENMRTNWYQDALQQAIVLDKIHEGS